jgi:hypothetical protein
MARHIVDFMMTGQSQAASGMAAHLLNRDQIIEINPRAGEGDYGLDKLSPALVALAESEWRHASSDLAEKGFFDHEASEFSPCHQLQPTLK